MKEEVKEVGLSRREMLKGVAGTGVLLLLPMLAERAGAAPVVPVWTNVGPAGQFLLNTPSRVALKDGSVLWITRTGPKALLAVSAKCTHHGCEVGWAATDKQFECPCHGAAFGTDGHNVHGTRRHPDEKLSPLTDVPVRQVHSQVQVSITAFPVGTLVPGATS